MSNDINNYVKQLAGKYAGGDIVKKERPEPKEYALGEDRGRSRNEPLPTGTPKLWPSEKIMVGASKGKPIPKRPKVMMAMYSDQELEEMLKTPAKRSWDFEVWLEVIGLPTDLHETHDAPMYQYAARAYLDRKKEAHQTHG